MPLAPITPNCDLHYRDECFANAWEAPESALLLHGNAESGEAWNGWMPLLGRRFRVVRPDMRGFGRSTPMPEGHPWSIDGLIDDYMGLADRLGLDRFHLVAAKIACPIAMRLAARHPARLRSLTVLGGLVSGKASVGDRAASWLEHIEKHGVESWARWTMPGRLGSSCIEAASTNRCVSSTSGYCLPTPATGSRHSCMVSSTLALSTEQSFRRRARAALKPACAMRSISGSL